MAGDIIEFEKCKGNENLREIEKEIELAATKASQGNHRFLLYLLEMALLEAKALLGSDQKEPPRQQ